jgi:D-xylose transport system ATP-binding protein
LPRHSKVTAGTEALRVDNVSKWFGRVHALDQVSMSVDQGEVVALVGDNGAGKSTLVKIISGVLAPNGGSLFVQGQPAPIRSPNDAAAWGIRAIHQDLALADNLNVVENLFLGRELSRGVGPLRRVDFPTMRERTKAALSDLGLATITDIGGRVGQLSGGQRQTIAVARATLDTTYNILLLDEPTTGLGVAESRQVMDLVLRLRRKGIAIMVVSQNIEEVFELADRIVVLHRGEVGAVFRRADTTTEIVINAIMGRTT